MALKTQASFSAGELDPALQERVTLERYGSALATLRNAHIGKTGRIISRAGRKHAFKTKLSNRRVILYGVDETNYLLEWGHQYVRVHNVSAGTYQELSHSLVESDLDSLHFELSGNFLYCFCAGKTIMRLLVSASAAFASLPVDVFGIPSTVITGATSSGTGYDVDYFCHFVFGRQPGMGAATTGVYSLNLPIGSAEVNRIFAASSTTFGKPVEARFYRRPTAGGGGAYGYVGSIFEFTLSGSFWDGYFDDVGVDADYSQQPPGTNVERGVGGQLDEYVPTNWQSQTGTIYQNRLLLTVNTQRERIEASRPSYQNNFFRDYPLSFDSALTFRAGAGKNANVLRMIESESGLIVFTTRGPYVHQGLLSPNNLGLEKRANYVIDELAGPLEHPDGILFMDKKTNSVRIATYSDEALRITGDDLSIFSAHLFKGKRVRSWAFQDGDIPLTWIIFTDGTCAHLTYQRDQNMQAWGRADNGRYPYEYVTVQRNGVNSTAYFVVNKDGERYVEYTTPRDVSDLKTYVGMDAAVVKNEVLAGTITLVPVVADDWDGQLTMTASTASFANTAGNGAAGSIFRYFDEDDTALDLRVVTYTSTTVLTVEIVDGLTWPSDEATALTMYKTFDTVTGLSHLEGETVSITVDGAVVASPNNNIEFSDADLVTVSSGQIVLPNGLRGAFIQVGRPFTSDVETLDIATVEQRPVFIESKIVGKVYVKVYNSRGLFVAQKFAGNDKIKDDNVRMEDIEQWYPDYDSASNGDSEDEGILGNRPKQPETRRVEIIIPGDWDSNGRICVRQVDPLAYELLSIIPDLTDLPRGR